MNYRESEALKVRYLTFALAKGRLARKTLELLEQIGITMEEMKDPSTRKRRQLQMEVNPNIVRTVMLKQMLQQSEKLPK